MKIKDVIRLEYLYGGSAPRAWTWWTVLAVLLATTYVIFGVGQLINDPKATNFGALAILAGFAGLIFAGAQTPSSTEDRRQLDGHLRNGAGSDGLLGHRPGACGSRDHLWGRY